MLLADSALIKVVPGLMIWTIICFLITLFVLKRFAFGPIQKMIDERRERIQRSIEEAEKARAEARSLLEEHRALIAKARGQGEEILAEARRVADAQRQRVKEETEADRQRRLEETKRQIEAETQRALQQIRAEVAELLDAARDDKGDGEDPRRLRPSPPDRRRDQGSRLLRARAGARPIGAVHRTYAQALFEAAKDAGRLPRSTRTSGISRGGRGRSGAAERLAQSQVDPKTKADLLQELMGEADAPRPKLPAARRRKGRIGDIEDIAHEFERLVAKEERVERRAHDCLRAVGSEEATAILGQIEQASGRKLDATRKVDPSLIGGFVLQAGSMRVDASVRGRLNRLRQELVTSR